MAFTHEQAGFSPKIKEQGRTFRLVKRFSPMSSREYLEEQGRTLKDRGSIKNFRVKDSFSRRRGTGFWALYVR